ncbi:NDR1/HIN1-like protein 13 [Linum grandiflorum]
MAERVYPAKPATDTTATAAFPATKSQLYGANRPAYRPQPQRKFRSRRSCCCRLCFWITLILLLLILLAAIAGSAVYLIYRPHRPTFAVSGLRISALNVSSTSLLTSNVAVNVTARNPNKNVVFVYDPAGISLFSSDGVDLGKGTVPAFVHGKKNSTVLKVSVNNGGKHKLEEAAAGKLRKELKGRNGVGLKIVVDTKVKVKMGGMKTPKMPIRVSCSGIRGSAPTGKSPTSGSVSGADCKVDLRVKIWKWTF